jgi:tRNA modification GTPase
MVVAIAGPPNAGKSTLLNRIARREAAIVSPYAGTTRDVIEVHLDLGGLPVTLLDTAGIRETDDPVEMEGVRRAQVRAAEADLVLWVVDASDGLAAEASRHCGGKTESVPLQWLVHNKGDLLVGGGALAEKEYNNETKGRSNDSLNIMVNAGLTGRSEPSITICESEFNISAQTGRGIPGLLSALASHAAGFLAGAESSLITRARHRKALEDAGAALRRAADRPVADREDLLAEELRLAAQLLGRLTGRVDVEDILDVIFRDFCIGK